MGDRTGRALGRRTVNEVAVELGCDWHTVNDAVIAYGTVLVDDPARIGQPTALGLDETLFCRQGPWRHQSWSTSIATSVPAVCSTSWLVAALPSPVGGWPPEVRSG